jgi:hypothetical protein
VDLARSVLFLRNAAPEQFAQFMTQFETYVNDRVLAVTDAGSDEVVQMQGRALALRTLLRLIKECDKGARNG